MSILIVGLGNEDFSAMHELDSDDKVEDDTSHSLSLKLKKIEIKRSQWRYCSQRYCSVHRVEV